MRIVGFRRVMGVLAATATAVSVTAVATTSAHATAPLVIGIDLPMQGASADTSRDTVAMIELYLARVHHKAGSHVVTTKVYDDSTAARGAWDDGKCLSNAKKHAANTNEVAVVGTYNSGCAAIELPVLNTARGGPLLMVSHANTNPGLTTRWGGQSPSRYYPTGERSYARVVATDALQASAAANVAAYHLHTTRVFVLDDGQTYGVEIAKAFRARAAKVGITIVGHKHWNPTASNYTALFRAIKATHPTAIYLSGIYDNNGRRLIHDKVAELGSNSAVRVLAPDGFTGYPDFTSDPNAQGTYLTYSGAYASHLLKNNVLGRSLLHAFEAKYGRKPLGSYPFYAAAALQVVLAAIAKSNGTRASVTRAVFGGAGISITKANSVTGQPFRISRTTGDTTSRAVSLEVVRNNTERAVAVVSG